MANLNTSLKIIEATIEWLGNERTEVSTGSGLARKPLNLKLCPVIIDTLKKLYSEETVSKYPSII